MATVIWSGAAADGNFGTAGNYVGASAPSNSDTVIFDRGDEDVTAGLTSGLTGLTIIGSDGYTGRIAPGANSLNAAYTSIRWAAGSANFSGNVTSGRFAPRRGSVINYASGTMGTVFAEYATMSFAAAAVVTNLRARGCTLSDLYNATGYTLAQLTDGTVLNSYRGGKLVVHSSCIAKVHGAGVLSTGTEIRSRGLVEYLSSANVAGTVDIESNGTLTAKENSNTFTFSTLNLWPGAVYDLETRAGKVTPSTVTSYSLSSGADIGAPIPV